MWTCPYCGQSVGQPFRDSQLHGMLCLNPLCGRFDDRTETQDSWDEWDSHDL